MAFELLITSGLEAVTPAVEECVRAGLEATGEATLVVGSGQEALAAQKTLAAAGLGLGAQVLTQRAYVEEAWRRWGDGTLVASDAVELLAARLALEELKDQVQLAPTVGTAAAVVELMNNGLALMNVEPGEVAQFLRNEVEATSIDPAAESFLSPLLPGEVEALQVAARTVELLSERAFISSGFATVALASVVPAAHMLTVRTQAPLDPAFERALVLMGERCHVTLAATCVAGAAGTYMRSYVALLGEQLEALEVTREELPALAVDGGELDALAARLFEEGADVVPVAATGTVEVWEAAGEHAQPELTARELTRLAHQACGAAAQAPHEAPLRLVVAAPEPLTWFEALAPKLTARGMAVSVNAKVPLLGTRTGFAMSELLESVSELLAAAATFEAEKNREVAGAASDGATSEGAAGAGALAAAAQAAPLPPMDWWPPTKLVDALTALPCGIGLGTIRELDATWQANRVLTPKAVLQEVHRACRQAGAEGFDAVLFALEKGRITEAAQRLLELAPLTPAAREARTALAAWVELAQALAMLGERGTRENFASNVQLLCEAAANVQVPARERRVSAGDAPHLACEVEVVAPQALTNQPPASAYAVVLCNMTRDAWSIKTDKHATTALLELMHLVRQEDVLARARYELWRGERVATHTLALERPRLDLDHKKAFPSVLFDEVLACYQPVSGVAAGTAASPAAARKPCGQAPAGAQQEALPFPPVYTLDERDVPALEAPSGTAAAQELTFLQPPEGTLAPGLQRLVVPPRNGELAGKTWEPTLSASQLERYLECPYKWYVSSRLQLATLAAEFDAKSKGTFAHAVLERLYRMLYQEALAAAGLEELPAITMPLPGSAVRLGNVEHAKDLLHQVFWAQVAHERTSKSAKLVRYVPHTPLEEASLAQLEATLARSLEYVAPRFEGFEPRAFELKFGGREGVIATYAGVRIVGTIDRLDVDAAGNALVIDYKTKGNLSAYNELMNKETRAFAPRHIQSLLYAQMVGRTLPGVTPVGALYLGLEKGGSLAGAAAPGAAERVLGYSQGTQRKAQEHEIERLDTAQSCGMRFSEVLDATEAYVAAGVERLLAGDITPAPCDEAACQYCPATTCKARLA